MRAGKKNGTAPEQQSVWASVREYECRSHLQLARDVTLLLNDVTA